MVPKCIIYEEIRTCRRNLFSARLKSWNDVTIIPSLLLSVSRFCTPPEVRLHVFGTSKHGEEKSLSTNFFVATLIQYIVEILSSKLKKICHIHISLTATTELLNISGGHTPANRLTETCSYVIINSYLPKQSARLPVMSDRIAGSSLALIKAHVFWSCRWPSAGLQLDRELVSSLFVVMPTQD